MEIKVTIAAEPALMSLLENLGKALIINGQDVKDAVEIAEAIASNPTRAQSIPGQAPAQIVTMTPAPSTPMAPVTPPITNIVAPIAPMPLPTANPSFSIDQLSVAATGLVDAGKVGDLMALLGQYGCQALTQLPEERYGEFATAMRGLGAQI